jgi:hypothetical protein
MELTYYINKKKVNLNASENSDFFYGKDLLLSSEGNDITSEMFWFKKGYEIYNFEKVITFKNLYDSITEAVKDIIKNNLEYRDLSNFSLEKYHNFVSNKEHLFLDKRLKRIYPEDLGFKDENIVDFIGNILNKKLSYSPMGKTFKHWIIVRLSLPESTGLKGFNPAHKDIYEDYDLRGEIPKMVNSWIPICGVNDKTGLAIAEGSHLYSEKKILRTKCGSIVEGNKYSVNCIKSWNSKIDMNLISPSPGNFILFSSHLIHGLAFNNNADITRVSLEFRLHLNNS